MHYLYSILITICYISLVRHKKLIITGCEERGDADIPYLTRYTVFMCRWFKIYIHQFHRADAEDCHDHPWDFISIPIWHGYYECRLTRLQNGLGNPVVIRKRIWPLQARYVKAEHAHRVELVNNKSAWTICIVFRERRVWGFFCKAGWLTWMDYFRYMKC